MAWVRQVHAAFGLCQKRNVASDDELALLALGLVSSMATETIVARCEDGSLLAILLPVNARAADIDYMRFACAVVEQSLGLLQEEHPHAVLAVLGPLVETVCLPLLTSDGTPTVVTDQALRLLLFALELPSVTDSAPWLAVLERALLTVLAATEVPTSDVSWLGHAVEKLFRRRLVSPAFVHNVVDVCKTILCQPDYAQFRQAVFSCIVPQLLAYDDGASIGRLTEHILGAHEQMQLQDALLLLCEVVRPDLTQREAFHAIVRSGLDTSDMMVRKMALHLLQVSLAFAGADVHASWLEFVQTFEVVHFHQEQHLLEQVWPRITALLTTTLAAGADAPAPSLFTSPLGFAWFQSVLNRCWQHDNPVVRRMTLVGSMKACTTAWASGQGPFAPAAVRFLSRDLLLALNDPFLYKHDKYEARTTATSFLAAFFSIAHSHGQLSSQEFVAAVQTAIFGDDVRGNSPDALLAMLEAFGHVVGVALDAPTWLVLRYVVSAHVLQSFPHAMKTLLPLLQRMLLELTPADALPLDVLVRVVALFPMTHLRAHATLFAAYLRPRAAAIAAAYNACLLAAPNAQSPAHLARLFLLLPSPLGWADAPDLLRQATLFRALHGAATTPEALAAELECAFAPALAQLRAWLDNDTCDVEIEDQSAVVYLLAHVAEHRMVAGGNCDFAFALNAELATGVDAKAPQPQALALRALLLVADRGALLDAMAVFDPATLVPRLLTLQAARPGTFANTVVHAKFAVLARVLETCWALATPVVHDVLAVVLDGLATAGSDPSILEAMVRVLGVVLPYTVGTVADAEARDLQLDDVFAQVWAAYMDSRKPDGLSYAVVQCLFQPRLLTLAEVPALKTWFHKWAHWAEVGKRPNVMYHLATTLCGVWRQYPRCAIAYLDELVRLLLYKEPSVDEKERMVYLPDGVSLKTKFVRFVALAFIEDAPAECGPLMDALIEKLLALQLTPEYQKPQMINSEGFGKQLRSWQALCILSRYLRAETIEAVHAKLWRKAFLNHNLPQIRYYIEIFSMRVALLFPVSAFPHLHTLLADVHLMPQLSASTLLVAGTVLRWLPVEATPALHLKTLHLMAPWLNSAHGHTRTIVQFVMTSLLPFFLAHPTFAPDVAFLEATLRFLSTNKECKRMFRRQTAQIASFVPEKECALEGLLDHPLNEFDEVVPMSVLCQIKESLAAAYAQFLKEDKVHGGQYQTNAAEATRLPVVRATDAADDAAPAAEGPAVVQRKIDPHATAFLEDMLAMYEGENVREKQMNARRARRQQVIVCASLVDKLPNVAGLARTCEIFNASKLLIPNMAMTEDIVFRQISVTAHKWVPTEEVKPDQVRAYCRQKQREGFTIVALEQTSSSQSLTTYDFPDKCVIVLGNEKEGIPVDILQAVDDCVEIPQLGVIRSLNVHVSGAILLWGYTQQQLRRGAA
ncbi:SpoU rRNA Methylase family [Achlya hypogyna]|uniref:tRNA (guanosine(18)-2'-O)-methyltransferase TARBP1 n=1 Tax=Achlya hypogyna TaxID=1202772 RepID=A0A1V9ZKY3_ACHHY|nr:SpoU rRNA Methylase family [Achlya hypogyna]